MFNPEKMLGNLLLGGVRRKRGLGGLLSGGAALGLVGVAMEAAEHYMKAAQQPPDGPPAILPGGGPVPPPPGGRAVPPPPPPGPPPAAAGPPSTDEQTVLLIRAMIAAANADGTIDPDERDHILTRLEEAQLSPTEREFLIGELSQPRTAEQIAADVDGAEMARQVYLVSLLAVEVDTPVERTYMESLAGLLGLDATVVTELHQTAALAPDG
jgi:uncharacterized membrane protein YebE (DUF533 family)